MRIPNNWQPRPYQRNLWDYLEKGGKRAYEVAHRRWGKDDVCLHWAAVASQERIGNYWHMLPIKEQARKAIWKAVNPHTGKKRIDEAFPLEMRKSTNDTEMFIEFKNGSTWQVLGSDSYDSQVGSAPVGVVFSEWALADPMAWAYIQPILEENGGWAMFITTPRGRNHASSFFDMAQQSDEWFCEKQTVNETNVFKEESLKNVLKELIAQYGIDEGKAKFEQEYFCSFDAALPGAYFGQEMNLIEKRGQISGVPYIKGTPVYPAFDFGIGQSNSSAITFIQMVGREPQVIDYYESNTDSISDLCAVLKEREYFYGRLILPHDGGYDRVATGMSYQAQFEQAGFDTIVLKVTPNKLADINVARQYLPAMWFDARKTKRLIDCLRNYHREWDDKLKVFKRNPKHDWSSHGVDSFLQACVALQQNLLTMESYNEYDYDDDFFVDDDRNPLSGY